MKILVTGGAGFIGSTVATAARCAGHDVVLLDSLAKGRADFLRDFPHRVGDIADRTVVDDLFREHPDIALVVHCAALVSVPESVERPLLYYRENVAKTLALVDALLHNGCRRLIFSSSASVYGRVDCLTVDEESPLAPTSPYAQTKAMAEVMLEDIARATPLRVVSLRYFNPIGSDPLLRTGPSSSPPRGVLGELVAAFDEGRAFTVTGTEYATRDGTGIRDYVHVWDVARAHAHAAERFDSIMSSWPEASVAINLGSGVGTTVLELVSAFSAVVGAPVMTLAAPPRPGDSVGAYASIDRAATLLKWFPEFDLDRGVRDFLRWAKQ